MFFLEHRNINDGSITAQFDARDDERVALDIGLYCSHVCDLGDLPPFEEAVKASAGHRTDYRLVLVPLSKRAWRIVLRNAAEAVSLAQPENSKLCSTDACGIFQHGPEHWFQVAGR